MKALLSFFLILLVGCTASPPLVVYKTEEVNICENNTITIVNDTIKIVNSSQECPKVQNNTVIVNNQNSSYVQSLIMQLKHCESRTDNCYGGNVTECADDLAECEEDLDIEDEALDECEDNLEDCEYDLEDCEDEQ